jgi:hypothetical protein
MEWIANPLQVTILKYKLNDLNILCKTRIRITNYILSKHPNLPEKSIESIVYDEIEDIKKMVELGAIAANIRFEDREPFMDKLIRAEVYRVLSSRPL